MTSSCSNSSFDDLPQEYDELRSEGHMARRRAEYFRRVLETGDGPVVEVGCGTGTLLRLLAALNPQREFVGIEPLANYVEFGREQAAAAGLGNLRFEAGVGEELVDLVGPASAGLVITVDSLHHVSDLGRVTRQVAEVTTPGGRWVSMEPNRVHPYVWLFHVLTKGERTFPVRRFRSLARDAGWRLESSESLFLFPSGVASVPPWAERVERKVEGLRPIAGAVVTTLVRPG